MNHYSVTLTLPVPDNKPHTPYHPLFCCSVFTEEKRTEFFVKTLSPLVQIVQAFPNFTEICMVLLCDISAINKAVISANNHSTLHGQY